MIYFGLLCVVYFSVPAVDGVMFVVCFVVYSCVPVFGLFVGFVVVFPSFGCFYFYGIWWLIIVFLEFDRYIWCLMFVIPFCDLAFWWLIAVVDYRGVLCRSFLRVLFVGVCCCYLVVFLYVGASHVCGFRLCPCCVRFFWWFLLVN